MTQATDTIDTLLGTLAPPKASAGLRDAVYRAGAVAEQKTGGAPAPWHARLAALMMRPAPVMAALLLAVALGWTLPGPGIGSGTGGTSGSTGIVGTATVGEAETLLAEETEEFLLGDLDSEETSAETGGNSATMSAFASDGLALE